MPLLYAGVDEAGYGSLLGPLCVGCTAFVVPDNGAADSFAAPACLWRTLSAAVCRSPGDKRRRIAVDDSKKLKGARDAVGHPLRHLERGVTAFAAAAAAASTPAALPDFPTDTALLAALEALPGNQSWHRHECALPLANDAASLRIAAATLRTAFAKCAIQPLQLRVRAIDASDFNHQAERVSNKATINFMAAMQHVDAIRREAAARNLHAWIALDQQGGRRAYVHPLQTSFPDARIRVLEETDTTARYRLDCPAADGMPAHAFTVSFEQGGEDRHLPVALASMAAKLVRELHMQRLNAFFALHMPDVKPTAGYVQDGRRFLEDVQPVFGRLGLPEAALIRTR